MTMITLPHVPVARGGRLDGKVALVTGASGELGRRVAAALGQLGAAVALAHRGPHRDSVAATVTGLRAADVTAVEVPAEPAGGTVALFDAVIRTLGRVDIVVHTPGQVLKKPFAEVTDEEFESNLDANLRSAFYVLREAARRVEDNGRIVTLSTSITAVTIPHYGAYAGHKAATEHYVRALAKELGPRGITVNAVAPGPVNSPFYFAVETADSARFAANLSVAGRLGEWDEIVPLIAFLCTPDGQWITAQTIRANGGMAA
jgi:NAD(P)-dependent dehydrogenase (short-subunit alcohol dehydrogenase family)